MKPFPGTMQKVASRAHPYTLSDEQKAWLAETFPVTKNREIMKAMGVSLPTLHKIANELGIKRSEDGIKPYVSASVRNISE